METIVTGDHFDVDFLLNRGCAYLFHDDGDRPWYEFEVSYDIIDLWRAAKVQHMKTRLEVAGASESTLYDAFHQPVRRPDE